jgi:anti-sigma factor RsiW
MEAIPDVIEELLEEYAMGRLSAKDVPEVFEHLIDCDQCYERYDSELSFRLDLRDAMARPTAVEPVRERRWLEWLSIPKPAFVAAAAMAVLAVFVPVVRHGSGVVQDVELTAVRGADDAAVAGAGRVRLQMVTAGVDIPNPVMVEIADDSGREVWRDTATRTDRNWKVQPDVAFRTGRYWVRVVDPAQPDPPLREYSFTVR